MYIKEKNDVDIVEKKEREKGEVVNWTLQFLVLTIIFMTKAFFVEIVDGYLYIIYYVF